MKTTYAGAIIKQKEKFSSSSLGAVLKSSVCVQRRRPVQFVSGGLSVTVSSELLDKACYRKPQMVSRATQTDMSPPERSAARTNQSASVAAAETAEERLKRYGLVRKQLAVLLHASLCLIRDGLLGHEEAGLVNIP